MKPNKEIFLKNVQTVTVDRKGNIISSDNTLFDLSKFKKIEDFYPLFIGTITVFVTSEREILSYSAVYIDTVIPHFFCDITLRKDKYKIVILFFNFTKNYISEQATKQEKNEAKLKLSSRNKIDL